MPVTASVGTIREAARQGEYGTVLRLARLQRGWTQAQLADRATCNQSSISRYESGVHRLVDTDLLGHLAQVLGISPRLFGLTAAPANEGDDVRRRDLLTSAGIALAGVVVGDAPRRVHDGHLHDLCLVANRCRTSLYRHGATSQLVDAVHVGLHRATTLATHATGALRRKLLDTAGDLAGLTAYTYRDLGRHDEANRAYLLGLNAADAAGNPSLKGHILVRMAGHGIETERPNEVIGYLDAARMFSFHDETPGERINHHAIQSWAHAQMGQTREVHRTVKHAEEFLEASNRPNPTAPWQARWVSEAEMWSITGNAYGRLARHDTQHATEAIKRLTHAIHLRSNEFARNAVLDHIAVAEAHLINRDVEQAAEATQSALERADTVPSYRVRERLDELCSSLRPYRSREPVKDLIAHRATW